MIQISLKNKGFVFLIINLFLLSINGNEIIGCGGFIKSNTDINYKIIQVFNKES